MIASLRGSIISKEPGEIILDVGGVGYRVFIPISTFEKLPETGEITQLLIITNVREDAFHLYGFFTPAEKNFFSLLNNVNGIGTKLALAALSTLPPEELAAAIARQDVAQLSTVPGVGKRTAQRIIIDLRDKIPAYATMPEKLPGGAGTTGKIAPQPPASLREEIISALVNLGYKRTEAERAVRASLSDDIDNVGLGIRGALKVLAK
ncbi:MAG: Holliday junction branch migration protein RuvA [Magnetococcales bacterium]|nr:Holliday junction branch migration protein RuvA [Magnetococcales bacterium]